METIMPNKPLKKEIHTMKNKIPKRTAIWLAVSVVAYLLDPPNLYLVFIAWILEPFWMKLFNKNKE
jgi:hypothetical protein